MTDLLSNKCEACDGSTPVLSAQEIADLLLQIDGWEVVGGDHLVKKWKFGNFAKSLEMVNAIGALAEKEGHHPDIQFGWGYVEITLTTHAIKGLSKNDFIMAAKIDTLSY